MSLSGILRFKELPIVISPIEKIFIRSVKEMACRHAVCGGGFQTQASVEGRSGYIWRTVTH